MPIAKCTCENAYQDDMYGKGNRVHNCMNGGKIDASDSKAVRMGRCTVCSTERRL